jgi:hypothetical protein
MTIRFWWLMQWLALPFYRLGWEWPMGYANVRYCQAIADSYYRKDYYGKTK